MCCQLSTFHLPVRGLSHDCLLLPECFCQFHIPASAMFLSTVAAVALFRPKSFCSDPPSSVGVPQGKSKGLCRGLQGFTPSVLCSGFLPPSFPMTFSFFNSAILVSKPSTSWSRGLFMGYFYQAHCSSLGCICRACSFSLFSTVTFSVSFPGPAIKIATFLHPLFYLLLYFL